MRSLLTASAVFFFFLHVLPGDNREYPGRLPPFSKIEVSGGISAVIDDSEGGSLSINVKSGSIDDIDINVSGDTLIIRKRGGLIRSRTISLNLSASMPVSRIFASSGAIIKSYRNIFGENAEISAEAGSSLDLMLSCESVTVDCGRGSAVRLRGSVSVIDARAMHGGSIDAERLEAKKAMVSSYTGGIIRVNASDYIEAGAGAGSYVYYNRSAAVRQFSQVLGGSYIEY